MGEETKRAVGWARPGSSVAAGESVRGRAVAVVRLRLARRRRRVHEVRVRADVAQAVEARLRDSPRRHDAPAPVQVLLEDGRRAVAARRAVLDPRPRRRLLGRVGEQVAQLPRERPEGVDDEALDRAELVEAPLGTFMNRRSL